jgi:hypothetical protein
MGRPKQAKVKEVFPVRLPEDRRRALHVEAETRGSSASDVIRSHLERYAEIAWRDLPKLGDSDWCAVFEALGSVPVDVAAVAGVGTKVAGMLEQADLARKWKVDADGLTSASRAWTFGQSCAVADAAARFHQALATKGTDALAAARQATTRPAELVLEAPARTRSSARRTRG